MIKKAKGIFLQHYSQKKEFNWHLHNSIFPQGDKSFKNAYKNYLSLGFSYPYDHEAYEEKKLNNLIFNNSVFKRLYRSEKKEQIHIDMNGYFDVHELLSSCDEVFSCVSLHKKRIYGKAAEVIITPKFLLDIVLGEKNIGDLMGFAQTHVFSDENSKTEKFDACTIGKKRVLLIESFPYWAEKDEIYALINYGHKLINDNNSTASKNLYNENVLLLSHLYSDKIVNSSCINDYFAVAYAWSEILLTFKKLGFFIMLDGSFTEFRVLPKLLHYRFGTGDYNNHGDEHTVNSKTTDIYDLYLFGDNLSCGLSINLILGNNVYFDLLAKKDSYNYFYPSKVKSIKFSFLSLLQKDIYATFYSNLLYSVPQGNNKCIGPYVFIANGNNCKVLYHYGLIPLNVEMDHFNAIKKAFKNKKL